MGGLFDLFSGIKYHTLYGLFLITVASVTGHVTDLKKRRKKVIPIYPIKSSYSTYSGIPLVTDPAPFFNLGKPMEMDLSSSLQAIKVPMIDPFHFSEN